MKEKIDLYPVISSNDAIVQFTSDVKLNKNVFINVPSDFTAYVFIKQKLSARIDSCDETNLLKYVGKEFKDASVKVGFAKKTELPLIPWGFGEINVKNEKLAETYRVGTNGKYSIKITDFAKLIKSFGTEENISVEKVSNKAKSIITTVGKPLLSKFFADTMVSVFEINSLTDKLREQMLEAFKKEPSFNNSGIAICDLTINGIHVNEEDMDLIRNHINKDSKSVKTSNPEVIEAKKDIIDSIIKKGE